MPVPVGVQTSFYYFQPLPLKYLTRLELLFGIIITIKNIWFTQFKKKITKTKSTMRNPIANLYVMSSFLIMTIGK